MDLYGSSDFGIDDLLDLSNDELFSSSSSSADTSSIEHRNYSLPSITANISSHQTFFAADLCFPSDHDVAELEWLSRFVGDENDSDMSFYTGASAGSESCQNDASFSSRSARGKRSPSRPKRISPAEESPATTMRRCSHCLSEKTPQWRTGPMGPKTLCNACGVRFKSGRLVPEYRPAASPTFVLTQHSNSHRKVMELRRQKELSRQPSSAEQQNQQGQFYSSHHQQHGFRVC